MVNVVFLHPDLGIGGAERAVLDAGLALKAKGHSVKFVTAHHDVKHSFQETKDGTFQVDLESRSNSLGASKVFLLVPRLMKY